MTIDELTRAPADAFVSALGSLYEHSPWVAALALSARPFSTADDLRQAMSRAVRQAGEARQLALVRAHPDLGGRLARAGALAPASADEQAGLGLDRLSGPEYEKFAALNEAYVSRFGFPFVIAVRRHTRQSVLDASERRLKFRRSLRLARAALFAPCCRALVGSFKIRGQATVGGNVCLALTAAPMAALAVALDARCVIWQEDGQERSVAAEHLITGAQTTILRAGDILRSIVLSGAALARRAAFRQTSLTPLGRSAALLIGTRVARAVTLTITASVAAPCRLTLPIDVARETVAGRIDAAVPRWCDDLHGRPEWRRHVTHLLAAEIIEELA